MDPTLPCLSGAGPLHLLSAASPYHRSVRSTTVRSITVCSRTCPSYLQVVQVVLPASRTSTTVTCAHCSLALPTDLPIHTLLGHEVVLSGLCLAGFPTCGELQLHCSTVLVQVRTSTTYTLVVCIVGERWIHSKLMDRLLFIFFFFDICHEYILSDFFHRLS